MKIVQDHKHKVWFTSDTHYSHTNLCRGVSQWNPDRGWDTLNRTRDFQTLEQMNSAIVDNINKVVGHDDTLIHLGDWSFGGYEQVLDFRKRLVTKNVILVYGNHDRQIKEGKKFLNTEETVDTLFKSRHQYLELTVVESLGDKAIKHNFICFHFPIASWDMIGKGFMHIHGHIHTPSEMKLGPGKMMDVGMDGHPEFRPYSLHEIVDLLKDRPNRGCMYWHSFDRHESKETYQ